jgi:hypothetical protein
MPWTLNTLHPTSLFAAVRQANRDKTLPAPQLNR